MTREPSKYEWNMMELQDGITTSSGNWYHTNSKQINNYIPGLLKKFKVEDIIKNADHWVASANGFSLVVYLILALLGVNPYLSGIISLLFFVMWYRNTSAFAYPGLNSLARLLNFDGFIYVISGASLIWLGMSGAYVATWIGLVMFFLFKVGLLQLGMKWLDKKSDKAERQDKILNMLLIRYGMKEGLMSGKIEDMQKSLINTVNYHKTRKKK
ncbi:hypothetical protein [Balneola vulgaris]|uniref:hypothetical protein n=1 Tax=Balneola vulgaris TaxID=287535 RepID=UPI000381A2CA|nr:hypothetical protein [Balneola vulgaris]